MGYFMKVFQCDCCGALVFFENVCCVQCGRALGFLPDIMDLAALEPEANELWRSLAEASEGRLYRACANGRNHGVCNWYVPAGEENQWCEACRLNAVIPDVQVEANRAAWHKLEIAKRRLIYSLRQWRLPVTGCPAKSWPGLQFRFLADSPGGEWVVTGHDGGVITLNLAEADEVERERRRILLREPQRTLIGHFRHESGHYYWNTLIAASPWLERFRELFGDERADYGYALKRYYDQGPSPDWTSHNVSAYASAHPWEDWAETWSHFLQMADLLETAAGFGMSLRPRHAAARLLSADPRKALRGDSSFDTMLENWFPLTYALNSLNRGVGVADAYPFVLSPAAVDKLRFVHEVVSQEAGPLSLVTPPLPAPAQTPRGGDEEGNQPRQNSGATGEERRRSPAASSLPRPLGVS
jgi:hypothetical protein